MVTDEQVKSALKVWFKCCVSLDTNEEGMRKVLETHEQSKWISVEDSLPDEEVSVLVKDKWGSVGIDELRPLGGVVWFYDGTHRTTTHWQLLPQ
jgi:hypothetical protein